jgi:hypothetical protein
LTGLHASFCPPFLVLPTLGNCPSFLYVHPSMECFPSSASLSFDWIPLLYWFLGYCTTPCRCLGRPCFYLFSLGHVLGNDWDLPFILLVSHHHLNFLCINAESKLKPFFLWIPTCLDPHVLSRSSKFGYPLILHDHFQSDPPSVGYVVLYVVDIPRKGVGIATSSLRVRSASHPRVSCCAIVSYFVAEI